MASKTVAPKPIPAARVTERLRWECDHAGSVKAWAAQRGLSWQYVYAVIAGREPLGPKILATLGLRHIENLYEFVPTATALEDC